MVVMLVVGGSVSDGGGYWIGREVVVRGGGGWLEENVVKVFVRGGDGGGVG